MTYTVEVRPQYSPIGWAGHCRVPLCRFILNERAQYIEHASYASALLYVSHIIDHATGHGWRVDDDTDGCADHRKGCGWMVEEADGEVLYEVEIYG